MQARLQVASFTARAEGLMGMLRTVLQRVWRRDKKETAKETEGWREGTVC
ncbi:hypothetical protein DsansV1_C29g0208761 [Dioscorea sansibarensis]